LQETTTLMSRNSFRPFCFSFLFLLLFTACSWGQHPAGSVSSITPPSGNAGAYVQDGSDWQVLAQASPAKLKTKHGFASSLTYGAVAAPVVAIYPGTHAQVQVHGARPMICVYHMMTPEAPILVRLVEKKDTRELDSGHIRASLTGSTHQAVADAGIVVPTTTTQAEDHVILLRPQSDLAPGEYAVMFGAQNMAILDFGVAVP
jgi:hypothetical protein